MAKYVNSDGLAYYNTKIKALLAGKAASSHTHNYAGSASAGGAAKSVANSLSIQLNGGTATTFNGSAARSINITASSIGAAASSHSHNYAGSTSAGGSAKSVANSLSIQLNGGAATTFNGSAARSINITASSVGAAASSHSHNRLELMGSDSITTPTQDTQANWAKVGNSVHYFTKTGEITDQKSQYGFVVNITNGSSDVHQVWMTQTSGSLYHRGANSSGWSGTWRRIIDSTELVNNKNSTGCLNTFNTDWSKIPSLNTLAYWDGAHSISSDGQTHYSSLAYCIKGAFGNIVTRTVSGVNNYNVSDLYNFGATGTIPTLETLAYWNGAWGMNDEKTWHYSNLEYCKVGKFGSGAIRNITYGTAAPSGTANNGDIYIQYS